MPYIHMNFSQKLSPEQKQRIKEATGKDIEILPNKSEKVLMLRIDHDTQTYFRGVVENCLYVSVNLYMTSQFEKKGEFARALIKDIGEITGIMPENIFMSFSEYNNWVSAGNIR
jgi:hypothetical protein